MCAATAREAYELFASAAADSDGGCVKLWDLRASRWGCHSTPPGYHSTAYVDRAGCRRLHRVF